MKKICIVTWYKSMNYGTCLQAYGLYRYLEDMGNDCYILEQSKYRFVYEPMSIVEELISRRHRKIEEDTSLSFEQCKKDFGEQIRLRDLAINDFVSTHYKIIRVNSFNEFKSLEDKFDCFISGSDQMWNPNYFVRTNMLSFVKHKKKIAYAGSFGVEELPNRIKKTYSKLLGKYSDISVREVAGIKLIENLIGKQPEHVVDPTMLLDYKKWEWIADNTVFQCEAEYLLCYFVGENNTYWEKANSLSKKLGLKLVVIPYTPKSYYLSYDALQGVGPAEFLKAIRNANFVCTDSFHAAVFSLIFHRDFLILKRFNEENKISQNSRLTTLLGKVGLTDRMIGLSENIPEELHIKNYEAIDMMLNKEIISSQEFLEKALSK